jgi:hypothetical protein
MTDVFISYRRAERAKVEPIKNRLESLGLAVFFDVQAIDGGADFPTVIDEALRGAKAVMACWSAPYFDRRPQPDWCMIECRAGQRKNVLVPIAIGRFPQNAPPADLQTINYFDLCDWNGADQHSEWQRTLSTLSRHIGRKLANSREEEATPTTGLTVAEQQLWNDFLRIEDKIKRRSFDSEFTEFNALKAAEQALASLNIIILGKEGEQFNPGLHQVVGRRNSRFQGGGFVEVVRSGFQKLDPQHPDIPWTQAALVIVSSGSDLTP